MKKNLRFSFSLGEPAEHIFYFQLLCLFSFVALMLVGWLMGVTNPRAVEPFWERFLVSGYFLAVLGASLVSERVRGRIVRLVLAGLFLVVGWHVRLAVLNDFSLNYALGLFVGISGASIFFRNLRQLIWFQAYSVVAIVLGLVMSERVLVSPYLYLLYVVSICLIYYAIISLRMRIQSQLEKSQASLLTVFNESADGLFVVDLRSLKTIDCNQRAVEMLEVDKKSDLVNVELNEWLKAPFARDEVMQIVNLILAKGYWQGELLFVTRKGRDMWGDFYVKKSVLQGEEVFYVRLSDVTVRKQAEEMVYQKTEEMRRFGRAMENLVEHVIITDVGGRILYANNAVDKVTGYSKEEVIGQTPALWGGQMPKECYEQMWRQIKEMKQSYEGVLTNKRKGGELYSARVSISPILDQAGAVEFFVGVERDISREVELEKSLAAERDRAQGIINSMGEGLLVVDDGFKVVQLNKAACDLLEVEAGEVIGQPWTEVVTAYTGAGQALPVEDKSFYRALQGERRVVTALKDGHYYKSRSGRLFPIISVTTRLEGVGVVKVFRDMTDEVAAKEALQKERDRAAAIVKSMGEGLLVIDDQFKVVIINPAAETLLGVKAVEVVGGRWSDVIKAFEGEREIPFERRAFRRVVLTGETVVTDLDQDHYYMRRDGRKFPLISVTAPLTGGGKIGAVKVFRDATIEKAAKQKVVGELKAEQATSLSILENTGEGVVLTDDAGRVTYVNPALEKMLGWFRADLVGGVWADKVRAYDLNDKLVAAAELSDAAAVTARHQEIKVQLETKGGGKVAVVINAAPVRVEGEFRGVVRVVHDFSEDLALQRSKDDFFSIASHELRTPLTVISGNINTVLEGYGGSNLAQTDRQLLEDSEEAGERLIRMVNNFLNVSRLDQGRLRVDIRPVDGCRVVKEVVEEMRSLFEGKELSLACDCQLSWRRVAADEGLLREIVVNLLGNSLKFTEKGGVEVQGVVGDRQLIIRVRDTGIGIAKEKQELLFRRFQQVMQRTISREAGGTGLGLYIAREFARMMGGDLVLVRSELGRGSEFELTLPLVLDLSEAEK